MKELETAATQEVAQIETNELANVGTPNTDFNQFLNAEKGAMKTMLDKVTKMKDKEAFAANIAMTYLDLNLGEDMRMMFVGVKQHGIVNKETGEETTLPAVVLVDEKKNFFVYCATQFVNTIIDRNLPIGTELEFSWSGSKKTQSGGNMRLHTIKPLLD
jgi:hypothetical protein